jgi:hypothetical protein
MIVASGAKRMCFSSCRVGENSWGSSGRETLTAFFGQRFLVGIGELIRSLVCSVDASSQSEMLPERASSEWIDHRGFDGSCLDKPPVLRYIRCTVSFSCHLGFAAHEKEKYRVVLTQEYHLRHRSAASIQAMCLPLTEQTQ